MFNKLLWLGALLVVRLSDVIYAEKTMMVVANQSLEHFHVNVPNGILILFMETENVKISFNFTVECESTGEKYILRAKVDDIGLVKLRASDVLVDCSERIIDTTPVLVNNVSSSNPTYATHDNENMRKRRYVVHGAIPLTMDVDMIGKTFITFVLQSNSSTDNTDKNHNYKIPLSVLRTVRPIDTAFRIIIYVFLVFVNLAFGAKLDLDVVKENIKRPLAPVIGLLGQFVAMPLVSETIY